VQNRGVWQPKTADRVSSEKRIVKGETWTTEAGPKATKGYSPFHRSCLTAGEENAVP
jgi:hypothetical protein